MIKKFLASVCVVIAAVCVSCDNDEETTWQHYKEWREYNQQWLIEKVTQVNEDGTSYYERVVLPTDPQAYVLMHNIGEVHSQNYKPLYTSTTKVNYTLTLANDSVMDKGTGFVSQLNSTGLITGWGIAIMQLHVGDSASFIVPYALGYGDTGSGSIPPYSNLHFNIKLVDIEGYEVRP